MKDKRDFRIKDKLEALESMILDLKEANRVYAEKVVENKTARPLNIDSFYEGIITQKYTYSVAFSMIKSTNMLLRDAYKIMRDCLQVVGFENTKDEFKEIDHIEKRRIQEVLLLLETTKDHLGICTDTGIDKSYIRKDYYDLDTKLNELLDLSNDNIWIRIVKYRLYKLIDDKKFNELMEKINTPGFYLELIFSNFRR